MRTFVEVLRDNAVYGSHAHTFVRMDGTERVVSYPDMWKIACQRAHRFHELGLRKGDRVAIILPEPDSFVLAFMGALTAGLVPVPMYPPQTMGKVASYGEIVSHILASAGAKALITTTKLSEMLAEHLPAAAGLDPNVLLLHDTALEGPLPERAFPPCQVQLDDLAFLQFTSGSTRKPKGVMVTHRNLSENAHAIMFDGLRATAADKGVSWLPMFHDMGLIGFVISPIYAQVQVMFLPTMNFVRRPVTWLDAINRFRGTITFAPNFAYALATRAIKERHSKDWDLSCLKALGCGAEPIDPETIRAFVKRFTPCKLRPESVLPCYGLAEATLAVSFAPLTETMSTDYVDKDGLEQGEARPASNGSGIELVSCGRAFPRHELSIVDESGRQLADRRVGRVLLRGPSVTSGYFDEPVETAQTFLDGWLDTGDLGYMVDGELFICGRAKDLIIINGKNYYPQDIERIAAEAHNVRPDQCIAFPRGGAAGEECVVVIEGLGAKRDPDAARKLIPQRIRAELGLSVADVVFIRRNTIPKTSSGKVKRRETRARLSAGTLQIHVPKPRRSRPISPALPSAALAL